LSVVARMGMVGAFLWLAMFGTWFVHLARSRRLYIELGEARRANLSTWVMLAMTGILLNAFFDPTIEGPQVGVWAWTLFGMGAVLGLGARASRSPRKRRTAVSDDAWLLRQQSPPTRAAHPSIPGAGMDEIVKTFDELIGKTEDDLADE
ncbi:MAG: hypothetical protein V3U47_03945, partial [Acidimicrobiia bacterium]